ncbi:hypothetical protein [Psychromicrobium lacuslunae]|uniref:Uncharacterized protein n=1 Tax=Psychromicrobium lacuslunae TaxID=1618207 RepID=A0A0D4C0M0_9MICC|nr:hypothetical protein [Psychromicrobium lacuslunae]AJT42222.1 hypothetical protein UM93_13250 [Psychromicrobium lacuslunae]
MSRNQKTSPDSGSFLSWGFRRSKLSRWGTSWAAARAFQAGKVVCVVQENKRYYLDPVRYRSGAHFRASLLKLRHDIVGKK